MPLTAIVTGAASGIGLEACRDLLAQGWTVYGLDVSDQALAPAARALSSAKFHPRPCDLRTPRSANRDRVSVLCTPILLSPNPATRKPTSGGNLHCIAIKPAMKAVIIKTSSMVGVMLLLS